MATDLKLLDSSAEDVKTGLIGLAADDLAALKTAEENGKTRKGVLAAIDVAQAALADKDGEQAVTYATATDRGDGNADETKNVSRSAAGMAREGEDDVRVSAALTTAPSLDNSGPANIAPATEFSPSGAPRQVTEIDAEHPAVDNNPRAHTTVDQNRIDFNDPVRTGAEIVTDALEMQSGR